ncbi:MEGF10_11 [Mytilus coruscus]|uniref:MEGF10_11 n=1 Tax=Mytilus coruscus TaxID=42192 RepID=A0A6J8C9N0_MYTCO|nr:MEGF10_11 [Mytilus coruscus]
MLLQLVMFTLVLKLCKSLEGPSSAVCKYGNGTQYCCYGYGKDSGRCVECHIGYESNDESACVPCQPLMYGKNCAKECMCDLGQRCDSVTGRCDKNTDVSTFSHTFHHSNRRNNIDQNDGNSDFNELGLSNKGMIVYSTTVAGVIVLLCGMYCLNKVRKRRLRAPSAHPIVHGNNAFIEMEEGFYDSINEDNLNENMVMIIDSNIDGYLEVVDKYSNSEGSTEEKDDQASNRNPHHPLSEMCSVNECENKCTSDCTCSTNESDNFDHEKGNQANIKFYQSLTANRRPLSHTYEQAIICNATQWQSIISRSVSSGSLKIRCKKNIDASCRRYSF